MKVSELGEFGLIRLLADIIDSARNLKDDSWQQLVIGVGDDAAAWQCDGSVQLATTDSMVQDTHFDLNITGWDNVGFKAITANLSDIAAMGGVPRYALVSLALPGEIETDCVAELYQGMVRAAIQFGVAIAGGNIASAEKVVITITVLGYLKNKAALTRSSAQPGDQIAITGYTGLSAAGLRMLKQNLKFDTKTAKLLREAHLQPVARVREGQILLLHGVRAAIDISDGLIADLTHICEASLVSATVRKNLVPIHTSLYNCFERDHQQLALTGGEDYELLFTATEQVMQQVKEALSCPVTVIGEITEGKVGQVTLVDDAGNSISWQQAGWEHFKSQV